MKILTKFIINKIPRKILITLSRLGNLVLPLLYYGKNFRCPVCESSFRKFLPYGTEMYYRDNALCPKCFSLERHRLLWLYLKNETDLFNKKYQVLHWAPEQCFYKKILNMPNIEYTTADLESPIASVKTDIKQTPFKDDQFDFIICNHVLEHIDDDHVALKELYRILKKDGVAILQVPIDYNLQKTLEDPAITSESDRDKYYGRFDHCRKYGQDYPDRLKKAGFIIFEIDYSNNINKDLIKKFQLPEKEIIYSCSKKDK